MQYMPVTQSMFLLGETRDQPMHVGGLQLFIPRDGQSAAELADEFHEHLVGCTDIAPTFLKRPASPAAVAGYLAWQHAHDIDFDYHVRRITLPRPGAIKNLLRYISLNHGTLLDRTRPMWEIHLIEGLADGRLAVYSKIHHSVVDGVTALRMLQRTLSTDPDDRTGTAFWDNRLLRRRPREPAPARSLVGKLTDTVGAALRTADDVLGLAPAAAKVAMTGATEDDYVAPLQPAPKTMFNVPIGSARRFAAQDWSTVRLRAAADRHGVTVNDVVLAMCSGALRSYLIDQDALPDRSLTSMVPVSLLADGADGNSVTAILVRLATDTADPAQRLSTIRASAAHAKRVVRGLRPLQQLALGAANAWPMALSPTPAAGRDLSPRTFNLVISNVPGGDEPLYWNGARLDGCYPASIPVEGQAMNITVTSVGGKTGFGIVGARAQVPGLQRILGHLETALAELEGIEPIAPAR